MWEKYVFFLPMKSTVGKTYQFPLRHEGTYGVYRSKRTGAALGRLPGSSETPTLEWPWGYVITYGVPLLVIGSAFGLGAGASIVDSNISLHPANVFVIWLTTLVIYVVLGVVWTLAIENRLNRYYFKKWGTNRELYDEVDGGLDDNIVALERVERRPPRRTFWMAPLMYLILATSDTFLVVIPAIEWPRKPYSYWIAVFRGLIKGFGTGGTMGMLLGYTVPYWPLELSMLQMGVSAFQTMIACTATVGIGEAWNITRPGPVISIGAGN